MNLYLLSQDENVGYFTYDSIVVAAESEESAREMDPNAVYPDQSFPGVPSWASLGNVKVDLLGVAKEGTAEGIILASFNAG